VGRKRVIIPRLDAARRARVKFMTEADKVINIDRRAPSFINAMFGDMPTTDGVSKALIDGQEQIVNLVKGTGR
jgi:hypothetical protein